MELKYKNLRELAELLSKEFDSEFIDPISATFLVDPVVISDGQIVNSFTHEEIVKHGGFGIDGKLISEIAFPCNEKLAMINDFLYERGIHLSEIKRYICSLEKEEKEEEEKESEEKEKNISYGAVFAIDVSVSMATCIGESQNTILDLVIYITSLNILGMKDTDEVAIVTFSERAWVIQEPIILNGNRDNIIDKIKRLRVESNTSIGSGLKKSFELLPKFSSQNVSVHFLTDGQENIMSGRLPQYISSNIPNFDQSILHLYGFSQGVNSDELVSIAPNSILYYINDISVLMTSLFNGFVNSRFKKANLSINNERLRLRVCQVMDDILRSNTNRSLKLREFVQYLKTLEVNPFVEGLILDFEETPDPNLGQIEKSLRYYSTWGKNYFLSYLSSMKNTVALNFKDNAQKFFLTREKNATIDYMENLLSNYSISQFVAKRTNLSNHSLYNQYAGCFCENSEILTNRGFVKISEITENDEIISNLGSTKSIKKTETFYSGILYQIGNIALTPYHPYRIGSTNYFPIEKHDGFFSYEGMVYDLILENRGLIKCADDFYAASLGHNDKTEKMDHPFFSSTKPLEILKDRNYNVQIKKFLRNQETNEVCSFE